jgi:hypothetical protein
MQSASAEQRAARNGQLAAGPTGGGVAALGRGGVDQRAGRAVGRHALVRRDQPVVEAPGVVVDHREQGLRPLRPGAQRLVDVLQQPLTLGDVVAYRATSTLVSVKSRKRNESQC